jgi:hypothetical protein
MTTRQYIAENKKRNKEISRIYDPFLGIGSPLPRKPLKLGRTITSPLGNKTKELLLPESMFDSGALQTASDMGLAKFAESVEMEFEDALAHISIERKQHDFEFWCASFAKIKNKEGITVPFILNPPQRKLLSRVEGQRMNGEPVREVVLKHRQWGCTTFGYTYVSWHQVELFTGRDSWFVGLDQAGAEDVRNRYDVIRSSCGLTLRNYDKGGTTKEIVERNALISIGTVNKPNAPSGRPAQFVHLFEIGKWPSNTTVSAEKVVQNVGAMMVDKPGTVMLMESSAQASSGSYFRRLCDQAQAGKISYDFLFVSWIDDPQYQIEVDDPKIFVESWPDFRIGLEYTRFLWDLGATLEQIAWYEAQANKPEYIDLWRLKEEFPSTAEEAFQTGGKRVFPPAHVQTARKACREPKRRGRLVADERMGPGALRNIRFEDDPNGPLSIWRMPGDDYGGLLDGRVANRYASATDIGGKWEGSDYSVSGVLDRAPMVFGGLPEIVAEWHGHIDKDLFAWESARLAKWYEESLLAVEVNSLMEDNETRYDPSLTVLNEIIPHYHNLYVREVYDNVEQKMTQKVGFHMNSRTKPDVVAKLQKRLREYHESQVGEIESVEGYVERCAEACYEMDHYMEHEDGSMGSTSRAQRGDRHLKDDRVVVRAILAWLHGDMPSPTLIQEAGRIKQVSGMAGGL